jgi:hypothetical protein
MCFKLNGYQPDGRVISGAWLRGLEKSGVMGISTVTIFSKSVFMKIMCKICLFYGILRFIFRDSSNPALKTNWTE